MQSRNPRPLRRCPDSAFENRAAIKVNFLCRDSAANANNPNSNCHLPVHIFRTDYLKKENIFASDVHKSHDADERKKFREMLEENREKTPGGSDLGLW